MGWVDFLDWLGRADIDALERFGQKDDAWQRMNSAGR